MVINKTEHSDKGPAKQAAGEGIGEPNKIGASTPYDFETKNLTAYGGLLPIATLLEKLGFQQLVEETLTVKRVTRAMSMYQFVLGMVLAAYVGFSRLHHLRFLEREPMLTCILRVLRLPPQCSFWRFLASLHLGIARQLLEVQRRMRERVWEAAHVQLAAVTLDTDTTVHTLFGNQMGGRKSYNPKNKGKKSYQPILTFLAETREYISGELRNGDRPTGAQIARHLESVFAALPPQVKALYAPPDSQYQLFDTPEYSYRVFVTNMKDTIDRLVWFYNQRAGAENLIKEANNDAGLAGHPSGRWTMNCNHFQLAMLAYNLNCWLMLFNREEGAKLETLKHTTLATARLRFLFLAAKIWRHAGRVGVSYSDHYAEQGIFRRLMDRLRAIHTDGPRFGEVLATALTE